MQHQKDPEIVRHQEMVIDESCNVDTAIMSMIYLMKNVPVKRVVEHHNAIVTNCHQHIPSHARRMKG